MGKGNQSRERIVTTALSLASIDGLEGLSLGRLADVVGMSKSGLFAHFRSKEQLELAVIDEAAQRFTEMVVRPAFTAPRGEPRIRALFERWLEWTGQESLPGGCVFVHLGAELDDRPGPARDALVAQQRRWFEALAGAARLAIDAGHFRANTDPELFAFQMHGIFLTYNHVQRVLGDRNAEARARGAFEALLASVRADAAAASRSPSP